MIRLDDTSGGAVAAKIASERSRLGSTPTGMVLSLLIMASEDNQADATAAAISAARLHPMRILTVIPRPMDTSTRLDAEIAVGGDDGPGEVAVLRLRGALAEHANSVVIPLLLSDTPVVAFWPGAAPAVPADDPIGRHAQRRITDAQKTEASRTIDSMAELLNRLAGYRSGDTDLAWARLTPWRSALAAAFDQPMGEITSVRVSGEANSPSVLLLSSWLHSCLTPASVTTFWDDGPGVTSVCVQGRDGAEITISRGDGTVATLSRSGAPESQLYLPRRDLAALLAEELRRLDPDGAYADALAGITHIDAPKPDAAGG